MRTRRVVALRSPSAGFRVPRVLMAASACEHLRPRAAVGEPSSRACARSPTLIYQYDAYDNPPLPDFNEPV
eukprot:6194517-Pleurochrysis_carterae.AAC.1